jgi:hypothetical protein
MPNDPAVMWPFWIRVALFGAGAGLLIAGRYWSNPYLIGGACAAIFLCFMLGD